MKIEKAIQWFKGRKESITLGDTCAQAESLALEALQEKQEREKECDTCRYGIKKINVETNKPPQVEGTISVMMPFPKFCPECGRDLRGEPHES